MFLILYFLYLYKKTLCLYIFNLSQISQKSNNYLAKYILLYYYILNNFKPGTFQNLK